eukprot:scaffold8917_cov111-Cylindrotheca_fusiformis.AAC.5
MLQDIEKNHTPLRERNRADRIRAKTLHQEKQSKYQWLPRSFAPGDCDIVCHHGKNPARCGRLIVMQLFLLLRHCVLFLNHSKSTCIGNDRFKTLIEAHLGAYSEAYTRSAKSSVIAAVITAVEARSMEVGGVGFVRFEPSNGRWYKVDDKVARDKVGHSLRKALADQKRPNHVSVPSDAMKVYSSFTPDLSMLKPVKREDFNPLYPLFDEQDEGWATAQALCDWFEAEIDASA